MLYYLNFYLLQWFFFRLYYIETASGVVEEWGGLGFPVPLTGWWSSYVYLGGRQVRFPLYYPKVST